jgi:NADH oxidoreductase Hcr
MSMVRWLIDQGYDGRIHFIHRARDSENVIFGDELLALAARRANFRLHVALSQAVGRSESRNESFIKEVLEGALSDVAAARAFLCGPVDYMDNVKRWLGDIGMGAHHIFSEAFFQPSLAVASGAAQAFVVDGPAFDKALPIHTGQSLLEALEQGGVPIADGCRAGVCGACRCRVTAGTVAGSHHETLSSDDITAGYVLACRTTATSDLRVEFD